MSSVVILMQKFLIVHRSSVFLLRRLLILSLHCCCLMLRSKGNQVESFVIVGALCGNMARSDSPDCVSLKAPMPDVTPTLRGSRQSRCRLDFHSARPLSVGAENV